LKAQIGPHKSVFYRFGCEFHVGIEKLPQEVAINGILDPPVLRRIELGEVCVLHKSNKSRTKGQMRKTGYIYGVLASAPIIAQAAIGPTANLPIANKIISPDGFKRSSVLAGGTFPGPVITAKKGDMFNLNVVNSLTDDSMLRSTSIVCSSNFSQEIAYN
jgi:hypothetical protein